ncbi:hypothetical protein DFR72_112202 [Lentzea flaviverrucosa]|uniref:Uncharacterized protein n=1 Tax=Lentzea flaviverrucosa TaxID=200379 RepID=A0A1H9W727_9PSEU|nr:hypothetical protein DFR72_112202 [Lentzea flaviverrucosa]SES29712.1 hypothetical protein SAMN05216195_111104 [Lentzea flaviverrucosa]
MRKNTITGTDARVSARWFADRPIRRPTASVRSGAISE